MTSKTKNNVFCNVTSLVVKSYDRYLDDCEKPFSVGERFFQAASLLTAGDYLGLQVSTETKKGCTAIAFSGSGASITQEDYAWIFHGCADAETVLNTVSNDMFSEKHQVYALIPQVSIELASSTKSNQPSSEYFPQLLEIMIEVGAAIRIFAEPVGGSSTGRGRVLFSLPQKLPLRLRTIIAMAFPGTEAKELTEPAQTDCFVDGSSIKCGVAGLLNALMRMQTNNEYAVSEDEIEVAIYSEEEPDYEPEDQSFTPIEKLDLSLRAYNCLKRAGIQSVAQLRTMSDVELMHVRNLGKKCIAEIRQKLAEMPKPVEPTKDSPADWPSCVEMLDGLVGLGEVKSQVKKLAAFAKLKQTMNANERVSVPMVLNMEFVGNPGTAKTTVARIIAGILHEIGLLPSSELVEVGRADLVAKYAGQTAEKVKEVFQKAKGKLLFIDEAYALADYWENSYGDEAISTIVQEMENNREDTVVIFAGYPDKMDAFFSRNPGLRSRVPFTIRFSDYSAEEMAQIVEVEARKRGFSISPDAKHKILDICAKAVAASDAGNGRFCRNLAENAMLSYAERVFGCAENIATNDFALSVADFSLPATLRECKESRPIGFR